MSWGYSQQPAYYGQGSGVPARGQAPPPQNPAYATSQNAGYSYGPPPSQNQAVHQSQNPYGAPPPGQNPYGVPSGQNPYGASPPGQNPYGAPMGGSYGPPPGISQELWTWFQSVDRDKSGQITAIELQTALMNGDWTPFNAETCRIMIGMFDKDKSGTIGIQEFAALWKYIQDWKNCFDGFDTDRSGNIDANELNNALRTFGYNLSMNFCQLVVKVFDRSSQFHIQFDDFIQACVMLKILTDKFRVKDTSQNGQINISYEEFLEMVLDNTMA